MRIAFALHTLNPASGGVASATVELAQALSARGHAVTLITFDAPNRHLLSTLYSPLSCLPLGPSFTSYGFIPNLSKKLQPYAASFDIIILNGLWLYSTYGVSRWARKNKIPCALFPHGMLDPYFKNFPLKHLKKLLYFSLFERDTIANVQALCYTTSSELALAQKTFPLFAPRRQEVVGLGLRGCGCSLIDARKEFLEKFPALKGKKFLLYLGRFHPKKGADLLLKAIKQFPNLTLVMAGPGENTDFYRSLRRDSAHPLAPSTMEGKIITGLRPATPGNAQNSAASNSISSSHRLEGTTGNSPTFQGGAATSQILWTGLLSGAQKWGALAAADALILPSHQENFGMVVAEALSAGTPALISDKVALAEEVMRGYCGFVDADTLQGTISLIRRFSKLSPREISAMRDRAIECYKNNFLPESVAEKLECLIQKISKETGETHAKLF